MRIHAIYTSLLVYALGSGIYLQRKGKLHGVLSITLVHVLILHLRRNNAHQLDATASDVLYVIWHTQIHQPQKYALLSELFARNVTCATLPTLQQMQVAGSLSGHLDLSRLNGDGGNHI